nr:apolipoprotein N-acyltransferase [Nocardioides perillae]
MSVAAGVVSGAGLAAAAQPLGWWWAAPFAVAVFVSSARTPSATDVLLLGGVTGVAWTVLTASWITTVGGAALVALSAVMALWLTLVAAVARLVTRWPGWPLWTALVWTVAEDAWASWPLGGFPWLRLAWTVVDAPWEGWLRWGGVSAATTVVAGCGCVLAAFVGHRPGWAQPAPPTLATRASIAIATSLVALSPLFAALVAPLDVESTAALRVAAVQSGVPGGSRDVAANGEAVTASLASLTVDELGTQRPDLVVWPENATAADPRRSDRVREELERASAAIDAPLLVGTITDGPTPDTAYNQARVWQRGADQGAVYTKRNVVPFGEYVPWRDTLTRLGVGRVTEVPRDMLPGPRQRPVRVAGATLGILICFDVAARDSVSDLVIDGAELLVVQTSNATFTGTRQLEQQLAITRARAVEAGRTVVVASTTGVSAIITPDGEVSVRSRGRTGQVLTASAPLRSRIAPAIVVGPWVSRVALAALLMGAGIVHLRRRAGRADPHAHLHPRSATVPMTSVDPVSSGEVRSASVAPSEVPRLAVGRADTSNGRLGPAPY